MAVGYVAAGHGNRRLYEPEAYQWFQSKLEVLLDMGVDCFKTDFGERIPSEGVVYHDGSGPKKSTTTTLTFTTSVFTNY